MNKETSNSSSFNFEENGNTFEVTFHANKGFSDLAVATLNSNDTMNERLQEAYIGLLPYEGKIIQWLSESQEHNRQYLENPIQAIENASLGIPQEIINTIKEVSNQLLTNHIK